MGNKENKFIFRNYKMGLFSWMLLQSFIIIIASVSSFILIELIANNEIIKEQGLHTLLIRSLWIILPMSLVLGVLNYWFTDIVFKNTKEHAKSYAKVGEALKKVANGQLDIRLDENEGGAFESIFSDFNKMTRELRNIQTLRNDFLNNYSHEFKTPITSINGFANLLLDTKVSKEEQEKYLKIIAEESARLAQMASSTILLSKLNSQQIVPDKKKYMLNEQLNQCAILLSSSWNKKNIDLTANLDPVRYEGNEELMQQLWLNLLNNAIKYTPEHGKIQISTKKNKNEIIVTIKDTGSGMNEEELSHIFDQYYQSNKDSKQSGLGLGLSIAKRIVNLCEGKIEVESNKNEGSTFKVVLPC